jgi:transposase
MGATSWASRSKLHPFVTLARTLRKNKDSVFAAIELGLTNSRLEALNARIRLINHRSYGFHSADPLIALIPLAAATHTRATGRTVEE